MLIQVDNILTVFDKYIKSPIIFRKQIYFRWELETCLKLSDLTEVNCTVPNVIQNM